MNKRKLFLIALSRFLLGLLIIALLVFLPAGTLSFCNGWLFIALMFTPILIMGIVLLFKAPDLLIKRLNGNERENTQKKVVFISGLVFTSSFILAGLDFRFNWSNVPNGIVIAASIILVLSYLLYGEVMRENEYLSRTIEVCDNQKVVDTGLYGVIRHPMYMATTLLFLSIPLVLGSYISFLLMLIYPFLIAIRIKNEEVFLERNLNGYSEYKKRVTKRLIPFIW